MSLQQIVNNQIQNNILYNSMQMRARTKIQLTPLEPKKTRISGQLQSETNLVSNGQTPLNYRQRVKARFRQEISQIITKFNLTQLVLVLDYSSAFLLSNIFSVTQLVGMKILFIQRLEKIRKKLDKHALYFINPTKQNIQFLGKDFPDLKENVPQNNMKKRKQEQDQEQDEQQDQQQQQQSKSGTLSSGKSKTKIKSKSKLKQKLKQKFKKNKKKDNKQADEQYNDTQIPQYRRIHLLFTTFVDKGLLRSIATNRQLLKRIAKNSLKQFYFSARIMAPNLIDINMPYLGLAFSKQSQQQKIRREYICKRIIQFIANYTSVNSVRIFYKKSPNHICQNTANTLRQTVNNYLGILLKNQSPHIDKSANDLTILLLDRSIDTVTPFIHYYTYEALLFDFFNISMVTKSELKDKGSYSYEQIQNSIYDQFRYQHISKALASLPQALEDAKGQVESLKLSGHEALNINIKQLNEKVGEIKVNIQKLESIWNQFKNRKIEQLGELQQCMSTGITSNNQNTSSAKLVNDVINYIKDPNTTREQRLRLAIICMSCIKLSKQDYENLLNQFNNDDKKILKNMIALGVSYDSSVSKSTKTITKEQQKLANQRMQKYGMNLNRYTSIVQLVIPLFCQVLSNPNNNQKIDQDIFGQIVCSIFNDKQKERRFNTNNLAICMMGGMSWSEVSAIRNLESMSNVVLMADSVMTAPEFIRQISKINIITT